MDNLEVGSLVGPAAVGAMVAAAVVRVAVRTEARNCGQQEREPWGMRVLQSWRLTASPRLWLEALQPHSAQSVPYEHRLLSGSDPMPHGPLSLMPPSSQI